MIGKPPLSSENISLFVESIDKNGDGKVSKMELYEFMSKGLGI
jgi:Ca2+-binding EF-hand superfamily protein